MTGTGSIDRTLSKANRLAKSRDFLAAHALYGEVLVRYPTNTRARQGLRSLFDPAPLATAGAASRLRRDLGRIRALTASGHLAEALAIAEPLARQNRGEASVHYSLGNIHLTQGNAVAAAGAFAAAVAAQPTFTRAIVALGRASALGRRWDEAVACFLQAARLDPDDVEARLELGNALAERGNNAEAVTAFDAALALDPANAAALSRRAVAQNRRGHHAAAIADHEAALALDPSEVRAWIRYGNTLRDARRQDDAIAAYREAIARDPSSDEAYNNMGVSLGDLARTEASHDAFRTAIALDPRNCAAHANLAARLRYRHGEPHIDQMEALLARESDATRRMHLSFALGKAYDDLGDTDSAFAHLCAGNALRRAMSPYDHARVTAMFKAVRAVFASGPLQAWAGPVDGPVPVFIVGTPRSGSSLTEQILAAHSLVDGAGETHAAERALAPMHKALRAGEPITQQMLGAVRADYRAAIAELGVDAPVIVDKYLANTRAVGHLAAAFPEARFIAMARDPVATCWSNFKQFYAVDGNDFAYDLADLAHYWKLDNALLDFWRTLLPGRILTLSYEQLTLEPQASATAALAHCGLRYEPQCLEFHTQTRAVTTASTDQVRRKIYTGSSEAWRRYEPHLAPLIAALDDD